jgi:hypothetical protein
VDRFGLSRVGFINLVTYKPKERAFEYVPNHQLTLPLTHMVHIREVYFEGNPPSLDEIVERVGERAGIQATYLANKWLLTNPNDSEDIFSIYPDGENAITLLSEGTVTNLLQETLYTLIEMGGYYEDWATE